MQEGFQPARLHLLLQPKTLRHSGQKRHGVVTGQQVNMFGKRQFLTTSVAMCIENVFFKTCPHSGGCWHGRTLNIGQTGL